MSNNKIMKNIHILPTDKPSRLYKSKITQNIFIGDISHHGDATYNINIYITSDEESKHGEWCIDIDKFWDTKPIINIAYEKNICPENTKQLKIILTTDQVLIKDGIQAIDDEFLEWFVKNPSCEEVEIELFPKFSNKLYGIIIPKEEPLSSNKQTAVEWLEDKFDKFLAYYEGHHKAEPYSIVELSNDFFKAKEMEKQQKGYSEEDVREMLFMALNEPEQECCITHTKDSIVRKVLKNFKSE